MQQKMRRATSRAAASIEPMTIPAIAPPESPWWSLPVFVAPTTEELLPFVDVGNNGGREDVCVGNTTPVQRLDTLEAEQQESVAFGELDAQ